MNCRILWHIKKKKQQSLFLYVVGKIPAREKNNVSFCLLSGVQNSNEGKKQLLFLAVHVRKFSLDIPVSSKSVYIKQQLSIVRSLSILYRGVFGVPENYINDDGSAARRDDFAGGHVVKGWRAVGNGLIVFHRPAHVRRQRRRLSIMSTGATLQRVALLMFTQATRRQPRARRSKAACRNPGRSESAGTI